jgi:hypothetical protein
MSATVSTDLLLRVAQATPEQQAAIERYLTLGIWGSENGRTTEPVPLYRLRKHCGVWQLTFDGTEVPIKHQRGLLYISWLLHHPFEPVHPLDLLTKIPEIYRRQLGLAEIHDSSTGRNVTLASHARLQERSLSLDDTQAMRALYKKQKELEAILDSDDTSEPEKNEALQELEQIYAYQKHAARRSRSAAEQASETVRLAIRRVAKALSENTTPNSPSALFANYIRQYIIDPSDSTTLSVHRPPGTPPGCLIHAKPEAVEWNP